MQDGCEISQAKGHHFAAKGWFRSLRNWSSAWCDQLPMALTSSFQLRFTHRLKRWTADFPSFEKTYGMHKMDSGKCFKSVKQLMSSCILHVAFILAFLICFWQRTTELQSLNSLCKWASIFFFMDYIKLSVDPHFSHASPLDRRDSLFICENLIFLKKLESPPILFLF